MHYAIKLVNDGGGFVATCRDLPAFNSVGDTEESALRESVDAVTLVLQSYMDDLWPIPVATGKKRGEHWVSLPVLDDAKVKLYQAMQAKGMRKAELSRMLGMHATEVDRLLDLTHESNLEKVERALTKLG
jgi:antitoxin HicB